MNAETVETAVPVCRRPGCERPATTTGDCLAHRVQVAYDVDPEWDREEL